MPKGIPNKPKVKEEVYTPKPDMGDIKPPAEKEKICEFCGHKKEKHYGSTRDWCNTTGCNCQGFQ